LKNFNQNDLEEVYQAAGKPDASSRLCLYSWLEFQTIAHLCIICSSASHQSEQCHSDGPQDSLFREMAFRRLNTLLPSHRALNLVYGLEISYAMRTGYWDYDLNWLKQKYMPGIPHYEAIIRMLKSYSTNDFCSCNQLNHPPQKRLLDRLATDGNKTTCC
jgi:hypothetical protein